MKKTLILLLLVSFCGGTDLSELEKDIVQTEERIEDLESKDALTLEEEQELENLREQFEELEGTKAEELEGTEAEEEIAVLDLQKIVDEGSLIIEWPEILDSIISANILNINFEIQNNTLNLIVDDGGGWEDRIRSISLKS